MKELFEFSSDKFQYYDWMNSAYKNYAGVLIPNADIISLSGGFGDMLFQGSKCKFMDMWMSDYAIEDSFTGRAQLDYRSIEVHILLKSSIEHYQQSFGWRSFKECKINLTHSLYMDGRTKFEKGVHYKSFDLHFKPAVFELLMTLMPGLVYPFFNEYAADREVTLFDKDIMPNKAILNIVQMMEASFTQGLMPAMIADMYGLLLLAHLFLAKAEIKQRRGLTIEQEKEKLNLDKIKQLLLAERGGFLGIEHYSDEIGMCPTKFKRVFLEQTGSTPFKFAQEEKLRKSVSKLVNTEESIQSIALAAGFSDHRAFGRAFKQLYDVSPSAFRNKVKGR